MNRARHPWILAAALLWATAGHSIAVDNDAFSKPVSFQYLNSLGDSPETSSIFSKVVSFQYFNSVTDSPATSPVTSPVVSYQYFDWPGDENVTFQFSPPVSYRYSGPPQILTQPAGKLLRVGTSTTLSVVADGTPPLSYQWRFNGQPLPNTAGAAIALDNLQSSDSGNYSIVVSNASGSVTSQLARLTVYAPPPSTKPVSPSLLTTTQQLSTAQQTKLPAPVSVQLRWFNMGTHQFENVPSPLPNPGKVVIVLTHGLLNGVNGYWPQEMAQALGAKANILAWDWHEDAALPGLFGKYDPASAATRVVPQGSALGAALMDTLGPTFNRNIHFIGHSLGTAVNCAAANYIHGKPRPRGDPRSAAETYSSFRTHLTLLDEAGQADTFKGLNVMLDLPRASYDDYYVQDALKKLKDYRVEVIPNQWGWIDNYVSQYGSLHPEAVNIMLFRKSYMNLLTGPHGYAVEWYQDTISISEPEAGLVGNHWSFEKDTLFKGDCPMPPSYYRQSLNLNSSEFELSKIGALEAEFLSSGRVPFYSTLKSAQGLDASTKYFKKQAEVAGEYTYEKGKSVVTQIGATYLDGIHYAGNLLADFAEKVSAPKGAPVFIGTNQSTAAYFLLPGEIAPAAQEAGWNLNFSIQAGTPQPQNLKIPMRAMSINSTADGPAYTIIPVHVPNEAVGLSFEYNLEGSAVEEFMTMGVGQEKVFTMEAKYVEDGEWNGTPVISVSDVRDQDVQLVFALNGINGSPLGKLSIRNIEFYVPPRPQLEIEKTGDSLTASWPLSAIDWTIETTTDLSDPNGWQPVSNPPTDADFFHTMTFDVSGTSRAFFRLKK